MDHEELQRLHPKLLSRLKFLSRKAGIPEQECDDVVQETLSAALKQLRRDTFRGDSSLGTWLCAILRAKIADYWRHRRRHAVIVDPPGSSLHAEDGREPTALAGLPGREPPKEMVLAVRNVLDRLKPTHRLVLLLNQYGGYTCDEIAKRIRRPVGTVGRILAEAKEQFRNLYRNEDPSRSQRLIPGAENDQRARE
jgi:RNA polymerase sigma-70 factor (ECF subfamily)